MKRLRLMKALFLFALLGGATAVTAQRHGGGGENPVQTGTVILNLGVGTGADYGNYYYNTPFGTKAAVEVGIWQAGPGVITLGGEIGASFGDGGYHNYDGYKAHMIGVAGRAAWHNGWNVPGLDTYGGVSAGLAFRHYQYDDGAGGTYDHNSVTPFPGIFVGASYYVTPNFGFNAEAGYDITNVQVGIVFKLM
ncbi:MAG TPA: hypothetical protein VL547_19595 [Dinghuibacter sp.]|jgi:hypothetical protein|uniref:hypothetical protein n=1 Tax=Dinghuibacter sp. TaxID=2024697 RepID=UPI002C5E09BF|nr:hypothetical protein [Dinghuibacter sp.]HTJ14257.1 hypothetical protein [Dinghuibacter sp.]